MVTLSAIVKSESAQPAHAKKLDAVVAVDTATAPDETHTATVAVDLVVLDATAAAEAETVVTKIGFISKGKRKKCLNV